ncbi:MAG: septum formation inhibitor Maf [Polyangiaceae bacterium]|nr:septum formation inhibitor Maf [Polyangiaceae bacterium]
MAAQPLPLTLASASPRRLELLRAAGLVFDVRPAEVDEAVLPSERPREYVERMARKKLDSALEKVDEGLVLAADTVVVLGESILGKPTDDEHAVSMLVRLAGRAHRVLTAVSLGEARDAVLEELTVTTEVRFRTATREELARYVATGEGRDKAGSYAIQGIGAGLVQAIHGSYTNVVGLPLVETLSLLARHRGIAEWP